MVYYKPHITGYFIPYTLNNQFVSLLTYLVLLGVWGQPIYLKRVVIEFFFPPLSKKLATTQVLEWFKV